MIYGSVCSGIEAATVAWHPLGWRAAFYSEIEPFPCAVLNHYYPTVPNHGDMTKFKEWPNATLDLLVGGTPCQSFSVAGLRKGLDDPRGNLTLVYLAVADKYRPRWLVWENVPGVLSDGTGAFGAFLGGLGELGYGFAYRVLDAQYFGVPQRRRRVFVVGCLGDWRRAAAVLFERSSLRGDPAPRRETGEGATWATAPSLTASGRGVERTGESRGQDPVVTVGALCADTHPGAYSGQNAYTGRLVPVAHTQTMPTLRAAASQDGTGHGARSGDSKDKYIVPVAFNWQGGGTQTTLGYDPESDVTCALHVGQTPALAFHENQRAELTLNETAGSLTVGGGKPGQGYPSVMAGMQVRRLTPRECERLQGFPDDYTLIPYRGKPAADGPRYKALGNSMAVPVMRWIGERIAMVEEIDSHDGDGERLDG